MTQLFEDIATSLRGQHILITGSTGFVGRSLIAIGTNLNDVYDAQLTFNLVARNSPSSEFPTLVDRTDTNFVLSEIGKHLVVSSRADLIFHCATPASADLNQNDPQKMFAVNVEGARWITENDELLRSSPRVVFTSSGAVYGSQPHDVPKISEDHQEVFTSDQPTSAYAEGKRAAEELFLSAGEKGRLDPVIARLFAFSGVGLPLDRHFAIGNFVRNAQNNERIVIRGTGHDVRSYLNSRDMAIWLWKAATINDGCDPLHIGSAHPISVGDLAVKVKTQAKIVLDHDVEVITFGDVTDFKSSSRYVPENTQTRNRLKVDEWTSLDESIDQMLLQ